MNRWILVSMWVFLSMNCGRPTVDDTTNESSLTIPYDADEKIFGPYRADPTRFTERLWIERQD